MKSSLPVTIEAHQFSPSDFVAGEAALDFVNTFTGRDAAPRDWLDGYSRLLEWAGRTALLPAGALRPLAKKAQREPRAAASALRRAKVLRETLFGLMADIVAGAKPSPHALALLRESWIRGVSAHELRFEKGGVIAELRADVVDLDLVAWMVAYRVVEYVLPEPKDRLRLCHGSNCSWLFIDRSKAGRRRWCDMAVCGNAAKSRRFYARARRQAKAPPPRARSKG